MNQNDNCSLYLNCFSITPEQKYIYWKSFDNLRERWIRAITSKTWLVLQDEIKEIKKAIITSGGGEKAVDKAMNVIDENQSTWNKTISQIYFAVGSDFRERIWNQLEKEKFIRVRNSKTIVDPFRETVDSYVKKTAGKKIKDISSTSRNLVRRQLYIGLSDGEGNDKLASRIDEFIEPTYKGRSMNIARTETCGAAGLGGQTAAKETGLELEKEWYASKDDVTREAHDLADGQRVPVDEPYEVDGEELMFPGDTSLGAGAGNVCRCRCTELYHPVSGRPVEVEPEDGEEPAPVLYDDNIDNGKAESVADSINSGNYTRAGIDDIKDPVAREVARTASDFTGETQYRPVRNSVKEAIKGNKVSETADKFYDQKKAIDLNRVINKSKEIADDIYRGSAKYVDMLPKVGEPIDLLGPTSYSQSASVADTFAKISYRELVKEDATREVARVMYAVQKGDSLGLNVSSISMFGNEKEVLLSGRYKVIAVHDLTGSAGSKLYRVVLKQVGVFNV